MKLGKLGWVLHIIPKEYGGKNKYYNLVYLHTDCHKTIHAFGTTNRDIQQKLKTAIKRPSKTRNKSQKVQTRRKSKKNGSYKSWVLKKTVEPCA